MKQIIFAFMLIAALSAAAIAKPVNADKKLLQELSLTLKNSEDVKWTNTAKYSKAEFSFKGQKIAAFYNSDKEFLGFFIQTGFENVSGAIQKKYNDFSIIDAGQFINTSGDANYFALVKNTKSNLIIKVTPRGKASIYSRVF